MPDVVEQSHVLDVIEGSDQPVRQVARATLVAKHEQAVPRPAAQRPGEQPRHPGQAVLGSRDTTQEFVIPGTHHDRTGPGIIPQPRPVSRPGDG